ncbi:ABC transporter permease, partial [Bacillus licheniformis]|uniref:FtsX-like permease family protein n=1 Tax=Bacillus licheniformis TaxID=1402 RepID=UPI000FBE0B9A
KSVGTTDLQIFLLLMKEAVLTSVLPVLVAQPAGFFLADAIYRKMQRMRMADPILSIDFSPLLSLFTVGIALFIVTVAMIAPARAISKLSVIDGIKGNFDSGARKKRRDNDLWKELRINHRHSLRALRYVMAV